MTLRPALSALDPSFLLSQGVQERAARAERAGVRPLGAHGRRRRPAGPRRPVGLRDWIVLTVLGAVLGGLIAAFVSSFAVTPEYQAKATLLVRPVTTRTTTSSDAYDSFLTDQSMAETASQLAVRAPIADKVGAQVGRPVDEVRADTVVQVVPRTPLLEVRITSTDRLAAAGIANAYAQTVLTSAKTQGWLYSRQIVLVESAHTPTGASNDRLVLDVALAAVAGGALTFGVVYLVNAVRLRRREDRFPQW
jgi:capsular polysaccharide biosynthesis protein